MLKDLVIKNRSFRGYDESRKITQEELLGFVDLTRYTASSANTQPLKYHIAYKKEEVDAIQALTGFIVICLDRGIAPNETAFLRDVGIAAQTILLAAAEKGLGGCMIGNFNRAALKELLKLPEDVEPNLVVAIGKPAEEVVLTEVGPDGNTRYYRDETGTVHYVPKRSLKDILL